MQLIDPDLAQPLRISTEGRGTAMLLARAGDRRFPPSKISVLLGVTTELGADPQEVLAGTGLLGAGDAADETPTVSTYHAFAGTLLREHGLSRHSHVIGKPNTLGKVEVWRDAKAVFSAGLPELHQTWDEVSWRICQLRDNPACADSEHDRAGAKDDPGLQIRLSFDPAEDIAAPFIGKARPKMAILR